MDRHCLTLAELTRGRVVLIAEELSLKLDGTPLARATSNRFRTNSHDCVLAAVEAGAIPADPWPRRKKSAARKKALRPKRTVNVRQLPAPLVMARAIAAMAPRTGGGDGYLNPASRTYQVMTAVAYYAGLRPSEVIMLRPKALTLPTEGWGHIELTEADVDWDKPGEPKTGPRRVPIPPVLVAILRAWIDEQHLVDPDQLLFRTTTGARPSESTWGRAWHRALGHVGQPKLRVYDCRHAAATTWLRAGVPLGEVARRLGHSVQTLVSTYVGALDGDEHIGNTRIEAALTDDP
jgi:integrase